MACLDLTQTQKTVTNQEEIDLSVQKAPVQQTSKETKRSKELIDSKFKRLASLIDLVVS